MAKVGIVMGSDSDMPVMAKAADILEKLGIDYEMTIISAHREPDVFFEYAKSAEAVSYTHLDVYKRQSPSCVAGYKLTGNETGRKAAILAADQLIRRFHPVGNFIQAWGAMDAPENYRLIIDCLLNLPLLYWASEETGDPKYRDIAEKHIHTAVANVIREDHSTWHTFFFDMKTGAPDHGATCQGYRDGSAWARGQAWGIYGMALAYKYTEREEYIQKFRDVTDFFLAHLPKDMVPFWDLEFTDGDDQPRDSSSASIAVCGMLEMAKYLKPVSYTHLDVYKRQPFPPRKGSCTRWRIHQRSGLTVLPRCLGRRGSGAARCSRRIGPGSNVSYHWKKGQ